MRFILVVRL